MRAVNLFAYCGLYCGDCAGYTGEIAASARALLKVLERYKFARTASCLFSEELGDYDRFQEMLRFMTTLRCPRICRERELVETSCEIKKCCIEQRFYACYECDAFGTCGKLAVHEDLHGDACVTNLRAVREMGLEAWVASDKRLWFGSEVEGG